MESKEIFSKHVLTDDKLKKYLSAKDFKHFISLKNSHKELDFSLAEKMACAIKKWALSLGASHYTHWFFPLTGKSAEKQISFLDLSSSGDFIKNFSGSSLIKGETDASSFPSGGERLTFEARGYTVWDYSSPVFIKEDSVGNKVLYIPTAFCSFNGVALDEKTPLLRATENLNYQATKFMNLLGYTNVKSVTSNLGCEQEYFLISKDLYNARKDLVLTGRTLLGASPIRSQEMYHHYYCQINSVVSSFMHDLNKKLWEVGIMAKIQHNEVAPSQHEVVPVYSTVNVATDQNSLLMDIMNSVAEEHNLKVLFHEKPFNNVNGSGKHNNWSLSTNTGLNLLDFNCVSEEVFLGIFTAVLSAIDKHHDLLRMTTASYSNDLRLGGNEAPPTVISVFVGEDILEVLENYEKTNNFSKKAKTLLDIKTSSVAKLYKDNCDRNRTSPFAFTGNKFEFRMVGSNQSTALPNAVLSMIVAEELKIINEKLEKHGAKFIKGIIAKNIREHSRIIFNGNSYDNLWAIEAKNRGLENYDNSIDSYDCLLKEANIKLFEESRVMSRAEVNVRYLTYMKTYAESVITEAKTLVHMLTKQVLPCLNAFVKSLIEVDDKLKESNMKNLNNSTIKTICSAIESLHEKIDNLKHIISDCEEKADEKEKAVLCRDKLALCINETRRTYDSIESLIPNNIKPFPDYDDMLFN